MFVRSVDVLVQPNVPSPRAVAAEAGAIRRALEAFASWLRGDAWGGIMVEGRRASAPPRHARHEDGRLRADWLMRLPIGLFRP